MRQHRLLEQGETTRRIYLSSKRYANAALFPHIHRQKQHRPFVALSRRANEISATQLRSTEFLALLGPKRATIRDLPRLRGDAAIWPIGSRWLTLFAVAGAPPKLDVGQF
jgi:hypothetical protein